ncbi:MAG TPA: YtxH domain-containing protein [Ktedonobacteraceae bacterium]|nr:YtxH domain-containing protein [Ktedonobacteraceae bacterium]
MAKLKDVQNTSAERAKDVNGKAKDLAQTTYEGAKDIAQVTYASVQDSVKPVINKTQAAFLAGLGLAQGLLAYNQKKSRKDMKWARKNMKRKQKQLQNLQSNVQENLGSGWTKALATLQAGFGLAQDITEKNKRDASKNLKEAQKKAQKNLKETQKTMQKNLKEAQGNLESGWNKTQRMFSKRSQSVSKPISQATATAKDMRDTAQKQLARYKRRRRRARTIFRLGLVLGAILALLYTPFPGSEIRRRIASQVERYRANTAM